MSEIRSMEDVEAWLVEKIAAKLRAALEAERAEKDAELLDGPGVGRPLGLLSNQ